MKKNIDLLIIKIADFFYKIQDKKHKKRLEKLNKKMLSGNICNEKYIAINGATLSFKDKNYENDKANSFVVYLLAPVLRNSFCIFCGWRNNHKT